MSRYRDDIQETAVASSRTWLGLTAITESIAKITILALFGLTVIHADEVKVSGSVIDSSTHTVTERALIGAIVVDSLETSQLIVEKARVSEQWKPRLRLLHTVQAQISDAVTSSIASITRESAAISDEIIGLRTTSSLVVEKAAAKGFSYLYAVDHTDEFAQAYELIKGRLTAKDLITEEALAAGSVLDEHTARPRMVVEFAQAESEVFDTLQAHDLILDMAIADDAIIGTGLEGGQAWTANVDTWAMSRYEPYSFSRLAIIDGIAYGETEDGVYALSGGVEEIQGRVTTGKLDVGGGGLVHPVSAYLEYELEGTAEMDVTTTQSGLAQTFTYPLAAEVANELTNGRFIFGRGLRGRHFSFTLRIKGLAGYINDLSVTSTPTKRRV